MTTLSSAERDELLRTYGNSAKFGCTVLRIASIPILSVIGLSVLSCLHPLDMFGLCLGVILFAIFGIVFFKISSGLKTEYDDIQSDSYTVHRDKVTDKYVRKYRRNGHTRRRYYVKTYTRPDGIKLQNNLMYYRAEIGIEVCIICLNSTGNELVLIMPSEAENSGVER